MHRRTLLGLCALHALLLGLGAAPLLAVSNHQLFLPITQKPAATASPGGPIHTGEGTYYDATGAGNCSFDASPTNLMVAAMNHVDYADSAICGAFVEVTGAQGTVTVRIVDQCPECQAGDIDLSPQAFAQIDAIAKGRVPISWRIVSPEISGPIRYQFKDGSNQWWTAIQIRNHRNPIAKLEYRNSAGQWLTLSRTTYNYFIGEGMGPGPYSLRVTDSYGNTLSDNGIALKESAEVAGGAQFPKAP